MYRCSRSRFHGKETFTRLRPARLASYSIWSASRSKAAKNSKQDALKRHGTLNPHPDAVTDPLFETSLSPLQHSASHALPTIKRKPTFSEMASSGYCPRSEDRGKGTSSRRRFWTSPCISGRAMLRGAPWTWQLPSGEGFAINAHPRSIEFFEHSACYRSHQFGYIIASGTISWLLGLPFERGSFFPSEFLRR